MNTPHKQWLDNEYQQWVKALQSSTVYNFKEHPMVKRMLGDYKWFWPKEFTEDISVNDFLVIQTIDNIGRDTPTTEISDICWRMIYYANMVIQRNPVSIVELGGGVGQFYAVLRALGYRNGYYILDIPEVQMFQHEYLREVEKQTGLLLLPQTMNYDFFLSLYTLGEFDDQLKNVYIENILKRCPHGFVLWNPHSGASSEITFKCSIRDEYPLLAEGNKQLEW